MDPHLVSLQPWEIRYMMRKFNFWDKHELSFEEVRAEIKDAIKELGHSRRKMYAYLRMRYTENKL